MAITAAQVNELRQKTGAGMMDCKKALTESNGDFEKAIEILRKKGAAVATKRAEKSANEGLILTKISADKKTGFMVEINCETDFVAKSEDFIKLAEAVLNAVQTDKPTSVQELLEKNTNVKNHLTDVMGKIGEKIEISRFAIVNAPDGIVVDYVHLGSKLGVLVKFDNAKNINSEFDALGKDIAMQVAAMKPICVYREEVPSDVVNKELEIYKELSRKEGKPEQILEKIALGRLNKFYQENCLAEQAFIKDNAKSVSDLLKEFNSKHGSQIKIGLFKRFHLSDEKK
jgi:elongation factor Ts